MTHKKQPLMSARWDILYAITSLGNAYTHLVAAAQHLEADERTLHLAAQIRIAACIAKGQANIADVFRAQIPVEPAEKEEPR